uniref:Uncharacterized protein n=1 Tax=Helianthus annuus TaxID=4232 RepID=A0A251VBB8_HELAN
MKLSMTTSWEYYNPIPIYYFTSVFPSKFSRLYILWLCSPIPVENARPSKLSFTTNLFHCSDS